MGLRLRPGHKLRDGRGAIFAEDMRLQLHRLLFAVASFTVVFLAVFVVLGFIALDEVENVVGGSVWDLDSLKRDAVLRNLVRLEILLGTMARFLNEGSVCIGGCCSRSLIGSLWLTWAALLLSLFAFSVFAS